MTTTARDMFLQNCTRDIQSILVDGKLTLHDVPTMVTMVLRCYKRSEFFLDTSDAREEFEAILAHIIAEVETDVGRRNALQCAAGVACELLFTAIELRRSNSLCCC